MKERVFVANQNTSVLAIVDAGVTQPTAFTITVATQPVRMLESADKSTTLVLGAATPAIGIVKNATEVQTATLLLPGQTTDLVFAADGNRVYAAIPNSSCVGSGVIGEVAVFSVISSKAVTCISVAGARFLALSHDGKTLLVFALDSNLATSADTTSFATTAVKDPGGILDRPVGAVFAMDDSTAYLLDCGVECGGGVTSTGSDAAITPWTPSTNALGTSVGVTAAREGLLDSGNLYVAGTDPAAGGTLTVLNASNLTVTKTAAIADGTHDRMLLANGQLFIGARACTDVVHGCLSMFNTASGQVTFSAVSPNPSSTPTGDDVTGIEAIPNQMLVYVCEGGALRIYSTPSNSLAAGQIAIVGAASDVKEVF